MQSNEHVKHLRYEIEVLKSMVKDDDSCNIITAIEVLERRISSMQTIQNELTLLDSSYPDGDGYWKDIKQAVS